MQRTTFLFSCSAVCLLLLLSLFNCDKTTTNVESSGLISGTLLDSVSGSPLDSVLMSIGDTNNIELYTDNLGTFEWATFAGTSRIFARKNGFETRWKDVQIGTNAEGLSFLLPPLSTP